MREATKEEKEERVIQRFLPDETWETVPSFKELQRGDIFRMFENDGTEVIMQRGKGKKFPGRFRVMGDPFKLEDTKVTRIKDRLKEAKWAVNAKAVWSFKTRREMRKRKMKEGGVTDNYSRRETEVWNGTSWEVQPLMHIKAGDKFRYLEEGEYFEHAAEDDAFYDDSQFPPCWTIIVLDEHTA